jgi:sugar phosphate isomerase/epimerase
VVFDTGNPICEGQDVWKLYQELRRHIEYVHIKDYKRQGGGDAAEEVIACFPGKGLGYVSEITRDLLSNGYNGGFSIEPHIDSVIHLDQQASDPELAYRRYVEYGRRFAQIVSPR